MQICNIYVQINDYMIQDFRNEQYNYQLLSSIILLHNRIIIFNLSRYRSKFFK